MILFKAIGAGLGRISIIAAWRARFLMAGVVLVHSYLDATLPLGIAGAGIIAATYMIPWLRRVWTRHVDRLADTALGLAWTSAPQLSLRFWAAAAVPSCKAILRRRARRCHLGVG